MSKIKILIVEDETIVALDIKNAIKKLGYMVSDVVTNHIDANDNEKNGTETANDIQKIKIYTTNY